MKKIKNTKGFTLMEMLIVVAIIAILIAIAIPTFNSSLNKAKVATDEANIRSGYAAVMTAILTEDKPAASYTLKTDGTVNTQDTTDYQCKGEPAKDVEIAGMSVKAWHKDDKVTYAVQSTNDGYKVTINVGNTSTPAPSNP